MTQQIYLSVYPNGSKEGKSGNNRNKNRLIGENPKSNPRSL